MKKINSFWLLFYLFFSILISAQNSTETFETESNGSRFFTDNGVLFNVNSNVGFNIQGNLTQAGWDGTANDNIYIDNLNSTTTNPSFSIKTTSNVFKVNQFWVYLSNSILDLTVSGSITITGKIDGTTVFSQTKTSGFTTSEDINNGYTLIDLTNLNGVDYSNYVIDELELTASGNFSYIRLDAFRWVKQSETISTLILSGTHTNVSCAGVPNGTASVVATGGTPPYTYHWTPSGGTGPTTSGLSMGPCTVMVRDALGRSKYLFFTISQPSPLVISNPTLTSFRKDNFFIYNFNAFGGTAPYTYTIPTGSIPDGVTLSPLGELSGTPTTVGNYNFDVLITDAKNCTTLKNFQLVINDLQPSSSNILYVDSSVSGGDRTGNSWSNALPSLADAMKWAKSKNNFTESNPLKIFVANGQYSPLYSAEDGKTADDGNKRNSFVLVNNVQLYGSFDPKNGIDDLTKPREVFLNPSWLIGNNLAHHVLIASGALGVAHVDGFGIVGGLSSGTENMIVNGNTIEDSQGSAIHVVSSSPTFSNLIFFQNNAVKGTIFNKSGSVSLKNSLVFLNLAEEGAVSYTTEGGSTTLVNATIIQNSSPTGAGIISTSDVGSITKIYNSVVIGNSKGVSNVNGGTIDQKYSYIQGENNTSDGNLDGTSPTYTPQSFFTNYNDMDYTPIHGGHLMNAGNNTLYSSTAVTDRELLGQNRLFGTSIDIGAFENNSTAFQVSIVSQTNTSCGLDNGSATAEASGGTAPYTYYWNNGATSTTINDLAPGTYVITVTDDTGIKSLATITIAPSNTAIAPIIEYNFSTGETLNDILVEGQNLKWFASSVDAIANTNSLNSNTTLVHNSTYYVTQSPDGILFSAPLAVKTTNDGTLGTVQKVLGKTTIHPNPVRDILNISSPKEIVRVSLFSTAGQMVFTKKLNGDKTINLQHLPAGSYLIQLEQKEGKVETIKMIKQ